MMHSEFVKQVKFVYTRLYWQMPANLNFNFHPEDVFSDGSLESDLLNQTFALEASEFLDQLLDELVAGVGSFLLFSNELSAALTLRAKAVEAADAVRQDPVKLVKATRKIPLIEVIIQRTGDYLKPGQPPGDFVRGIYGSLIDSSNGNLLAALADFRSVKWKVKTH